jgi:hypothetical protein
MIGFIDPFFVQSVLLTIVLSLFPQVFTIRFLAMDL